MAMTQPVLVVIQGQEPGRVHRLPENRVTSIGRSARNVIQIVNPSVSRFHCEISYVNGVWRLHDLNSRRGTLVNGERVTENAVLNPGDIIRLSTTVLRFDRVQESAFQDDALLALLEAELDQNLSQGASRSQWLDKVLERNRLESQRLQEREEVQEYSARRNVRFLLIVAILVALGVAGALAYARHGALNHEENGRSELAQQALARARQAMGEDGLEALRVLEEVRDRFAGTRAAREATREVESLAPQLLDEGLRKIGELEVRGDYAQAWQEYARLKGLPLGEGASELLAEREEVTGQLVDAARSVSKERQGAAPDGTGPEPNADGG